jgi:hypothetical protein
VRKYDRDAADTVLAAQLAATRDLVLPPAGGTVGAIDQSAWRQTEKIMLDYQQIRQPVNISRYLKESAEN